VEGWWSCLIPRAICDFAEPQFEVLLAGKLSYSRPPLMYSTGGYRLWEVCSLKEEILLARMRLTVHC
jgi:hypothetical protein